TWEVNIQLKLQEMERACRQICGNQGLGPLSPRLAYVLGGVIGLVHLYINFPYTSAEERNYNMRHSQARAVVERTIGLFKGRWPCGCDASLVKTQKDCIGEDPAAAGGLSCTSLFQVITDEGGARDGARDETDTRLLSSMAVGTVVSVLHAVRADFSQTVEFSRATRDGMMAFIHTELQSNVGSPQALKGALCSKEANTTAAIATAVTAAVRQLRQDTQAFSSPSATPAPIRDEAITGRSEEVKPEDEEDKAAGPLLGDLGTADPQVAVMEMQDGRPRAPPPSPRQTLKPPASSPLWSLLSLA
ncbi:hypothetical protein COCON_G00235370, partial [Conger conger]